MKILIEDYEIKTLQKYFKNIDKYLEEITFEEYVDFLMELDDVIISLFDRNQNSTRESAIVQKIYDDIYYRNEEN